MLTGFASTLGTARLYFFSAVCAVLLGFIASTGSLPAVMVVVGLLAGLLLMSSPTLLLASSLLGGLVVSGLAMLYLPQLQLVRWGVAIASTLLAAMAIYELISEPSVKRKLRPSGNTGIAWCLLGLFVIVLFAGLVNLQGIGALLVGLKSYFQVAGVFLALIFLPWPQKLIDRLPRLMLYTAILQLPFVLHQYVFLVPKRVGYGEGVVPYDIIAGTFGATAFGGGSNAVLSAFMLIVVAVLLALWNNGAISLRKLLLYGLPIVAPIFFNESKVSVLYLALIVGIIFKNEIVARPARTILSAALLSTLLTGLLFAYTAMYAESSESPLDLVAGTIEQNFSADSGHGGYYLNRWTAKTFWFEEHSFSRPVDLLIGHGPRASRDGGGGLDAGTTLADRRYPGLGIGLTGISALLWETGLLGTGITLLMFWLAFRSAGELRERYRADPWQAGIFSGLQAGVAILGLSLFHKAFFVFDIGYQTVIMLLFGYLAYYSRLPDDAKAQEGRIRAV